MNKYILLIIAALGTLMSCNSTKPAPAPAVVTTQAEPISEATDTMDEEGGYDYTMDEDDYHYPFGEVKSLPDTLPVYRAAATRLFNLVDTKLWISFDWTKSHCIGTAEITATPVAKARKVLDLDAVGFEIKSITSADGKKLKYNYDGNTLSIDLGKDYAVGSQVKVKINYIAKPDENKIGGSSAISSDKGLYFINPDGKDKNKPRQIWTQENHKAIADGFRPSTDPTKDVLRRCGLPWMIISRRFPMEFLPIPRKTRMAHVLTITRCHSLMHRIYL